MREPRDAKLAPDGRILVWDAAVRLMHLLLAGLVVSDLVRDDGDRLHRALGYAAAAVVLARLAWALLSRRGPVAPSVSATLAYLRARTPRRLDHDPLGLWMVWLLWLLVLLLALTGWMSRLDAFWGDERIQQLHAWLADAMLVAVALHLMGVGVMSWRWRENLAASMIHGRKRAEKR
ncbi:MAG TPA: cytochrome b/b6 domain-containing protein [Methylibium sp.]